MTATAEKPVRDPFTIPAPSGPAPGAPAVVDEQARFVDGRRVVRDEPYPSPLSTPSKPMAMPSFRVLTLEDGSVVHGCRDCAFTSLTKGGVQSHRATEHGIASRRKAVEPQVSDVIASMSVGEFLRIAQDYESFGDMLASAEEQREHWKQRAVAAERKWRAMEKKLAQLGFVFKDEESAG